MFQYTLEQLNDHIATRNISEKIKDKDYNKPFAEKICNILLEICQNNDEKYKQAIDDFTEFSFEFLKLQQELQKTRHYKYSTFNQIKENVYDNPKIMEKTYLHGMLLSEAFWINNNKIINFFLKEFCKDNQESGKVLEVPAGTGIFISEFINQNPNYIAEAYDISQSSIDFAKKVININSKKDILIQKQDIFKIENKKYDKIICGELLEHLEHPEALLQKLIQVFHLVRFIHL